MPNQHSAPGYMGNKEKILEWLKEHPQCTTNDIVAAIGGDLPHTGMHLTRLYQADLVWKEKKAGVRGFVWTAVAQDIVDAAEQRVVVRKEQWFGCPGRDPLVAAFFGPA